MKPTCLTNTNIYKYTFINMCGLPSASPSGFIIPLKSKLYYDETHIFPAFFIFSDSKYRF